MDRWDLEERQRSIIVAKQIIRIRQKLDYEIDNRIFQGAFFKTHIQLMKALRKAAKDQAMIEQIDHNIASTEAELKSNDIQIAKGREILQEALEYIKALWPEYAACRKIGHDFRCTAIVNSKMPLRRFTRTCQRCSDTESGFC